MLAPPAAAPASLPSLAEAVSNFDVTAPVVEAKVDNQLSSIPLNTSVPIFPGSGFRWDRPEWTRPRTAIVCLLHLNGPCWNCGRLYPQCSFVSLPPECLFCRISPYLAPRPTNKGKYQVTHFVAPKGLHDVIPFLDEWWCVALSYCAQIPPLSAFELCSFFLFPALPPCRRR
jgi:hypothetical protein